MNRPSPALGVLVALSVGLPAVPALGRARKEKLVPAQFSQKQDSMGFRWDINQAGSVSDGSNDCFDGAMILSVNGSNFTAQKSMMTSPRGEYVLTRSMSGVRVTRRVLVDVKRAAARYVEVFENAGSNPVKLSVGIRSMLGGTCRQVITDGGKPFSGSLGKKDVGVLSVSSSSRPCVLFLVTGLRSKTKPQLKLVGNRTLTFTYSITVKPRKTASIVHLVAQRRGMTAANVADLVKGFYHRQRLVKPEVPQPLRRTVVNFRVGLGGDLPGPGPALKSVQELAETLGIERGKSDALVVGKEGHLRGKVTGRGIAVRTVHGETKLALGDVALLVGGAGLGRQERVYLRSGEILAGSLEAEAFVLKCESGLEIGLVPPRIDMLFTHSAPADGTPPVEAVAFVETRLGERLAVSRKEGAGGAVTLEAATPWGPISVAMDEIRELYYVREPQPCWRLILSDGSRVPIVLTGRGIEFRTLRFGPVTLAPQSIEALRMLKRDKAKVIVEPRDGKGSPEEPEWAQAIRRKLARKISFEFVDTPLSEAIQFLQTLTKVNMIFNPEAAETKGGTPITLKVTDMKLELALDWILKLADIEYALMDEALFIATAYTLEEESRGTPPPGRALRGAAEEDEPKWKLKLREMLERRVTFEFVDTPLSEAIAFLGTLTKWNWIMDPETAGSKGSTPITLKVTDMTLARALKWIGRLADVDYVMKDNAITVTKRTAKIGPSKSGAGDDEAGIDTPHFLLVGENILIGSMDLAELEVATPTGAMPVDPKQIQAMDRSEEEESAAAPSFVIELVDGSKLSGKLVRPFMPVRWGERLLEVPVRHVRGFRSGEPPRPDADDAGASSRTGAETDPFIRQLKRALTEAGYDPGLADGKMDAKAVEGTRKLLEQLSKHGMPDQARSAILKRYFKRMLEKQGSQ